MDICNVVLHLGDSLWFRFASHLSRKTREANHVAFGSAAATTGRSDILKLLCEALLGHYGERRQRPMQQPDDGECGSTKCSHRPKTGRSEMRIKPS